jgi:hypothetical protein
MVMSADQVVALLAAELRAAKYEPTPAELARMRAFLAGLDARLGGPEDARPRVASWRHQGVENPIDPRATHRRADVHRSSRSGGQERTD